MRRIGVTINSLDVLFGIPVYFLSINDIKQYIYTITASEVLKSTVPLDVDALANIGFYFIVFLIWIFIGLSVLFIYFFTRLKVKEQFK